MVDFPGMGVFHPVRPSQGQSTWGGPWWLTCQWVGFALYQCSQNHKEKEILTSLAIFPWANLLMAATVNYIDGCSLCVWTCVALCHLTPRVAQSCLGAYWAFDMWLVCTEMSCKCVMPPGLKRLSVTILWNMATLLIFCVDYMLKSYYFGSVGLNKI